MCHILCWINKLLTDVFIVLLWWVMTMYIKYQAECLAHNRYLIIWFLFILYYTGLIRWRHIHKDQDREEKIFLLSSAISPKSIIKPMGETKGELSVLVMENSKSSYRGKFTLRKLSWASPVCGLRKAQRKKRKRVKSREWKRKQDRTTVQEVANKKDFWKR